MVESNSWNFYFVPPKSVQYSAKESKDMLLYSVRANNVCSDLRKKFADCRAGPYGHSVSPESCKDQADGLITCFNTVVSADVPCKAFFDKA
jgi:hypothetical protein